jgi:hypothetical protein
VATKATVGGKLRRIGLDSLKPDPENPRLPPQDQGASEADLYRYMAEHFTAIEVARSIARHGFFESEPLIAIAGKKEAGKQTYLVVEGNRRLVALKGLADQKLRRTFKRPADWEEIAKGVKLPANYPVVVAEDRRSVAPIIGFRHISGIEPWRPLQKARFIAELVDKTDSFAQVAMEVGESETSVRSHYRNFQIYDEAREFGLDVEGLELNFGTFTRAMNSVALRAYLSAPAPRDVRQGVRPIPAGKKSHLRNLLSWLFGSKGKPAVIRESREISHLAIVLDSREATRILSESRDLSKAYLASGAPLDRLLRTLEQATALAKAASTDIAQHKSDEVVRKRVATLSAAVAALEKRLK